MSTTTFTPLFFQIKKNIKFIRFFLAFIALSFISSTGVAQKRMPTTTAEFSYATFENGNIVTTHGLNYSLKTPKGFTGIAPYNFKAVFNKHPFNVSIATVISTDAFIMISAEKVTDASGILDYSYHKSIQLSGLDFYMKDECVKITHKLMQEAKDLKYIQDKGFNFGTAIYIRHYFKNTNDGTYEYVLNYGERVSDCSANTINPKFIKKFNQKIIKNVNLSHLN